MTYETLYEGNITHATQLQGYLRKHGIDALFAAQRRTSNYFIFNIESDYGVGKWLVLIPSEKMGESEALMKEFKPKIGLFQALRPRTYFLVIFGFILLMILWVIAYT